MEVIDLQHEEQEVRQIAGQIDHLQKTLKDEERALKKALDQVWRTQDAQEVLQHLAQAVQQQAHQKIAEVVSSCLRTVFGDDAYQFEIQFERKRGKTEAHLRFLRDGMDLDPLASTGGGTVDVAAFALRAACLVLHRPRLSPVLVIDEGFKFVSAEYRENVRLMLEALADDLGLQIIQVTHIQEFEIGKVIEL